MGFLPRNMPKRAVYDQMKGWDRGCPGIKRREGGLVLRAGIESNDMYLYITIYSQFEPAG